MLLGRRAAALVLRIGDAGEFDAGFRAAHRPSASGFNPRAP